MSHRVYASIAIAIVLLLIAVWSLAPKLHRFAYWTEPRTDGEIKALATDGWQVDRFAPAVGIELQGLVRAPAAADARWVFFLPGNSTNLLAGFRSALDGLRRRGDVGLALWAYRGFDASTGVPTPDVLLADAEVQWQRCLQVLGAHRERLELWGYSLGAGLAVQLAGRLCAAGTPPARVVLLSAYDRITVMPAGTLGRFCRGDVYDAMAAAKAVTCPVVLVHGAKDDALPLAGARALQQAIGSHARLVELPGRGHVDYLQDLGEIDLQLR